MAKVKNFNISDFVEESSSNVIPQKNYDRNSETSPSTVQNAQSENAIKMKKKTKVREDEESHFVPYPDRTGKSYSWKWRQMLHWHAFPYYNVSINRTSSERLWMHSWRNIMTE